MENPSRYGIESTSASSAKVDGIDISASGADNSSSDVELSTSDGGRTRKVLRAQIVSNPSDAERSIKATIVHQKRASQSDRWDDEEGTNLLHTTPHRPAKLALNSTETLALCEHLMNLYAIGSDGVPYGRVVLQVEEDGPGLYLDGSRARLIERLLASDYTDEILTALKSTKPDVVERLAVTIEHNRRVAAVEEFAMSLAEGKTEEYWRRLLRANLWMLGGGATHIIEEARLDIHSTTDIPLRVEGGYMDIVELKRPDHQFWVQQKVRGSASTKTFLYREKYPVVDRELRGAIAQIADYILQAERQVDSRDFEASHGVRPLKPRGLVIHGRSNDWEATEWDAFRLLNDQLHGVQVLTFDHVLAQARQLLL